MNRSKVDRHARYPSYGKAFEYKELSADSRVSAIFERVNGSGKIEVSKLLPSAIESYLASNAGEELLDVCTTLRCEDGQVIDLYPTQELEKAAQAINAAAPQLVGS